jgi:hypothetical protein
VPTPHKKAKLPATVTGTKPLVRKMTYSTERNIREEDNTYTVHSMGKGNKTTLCNTWEDAVTVFNAQLKRIKGTHQTLRNGNIMITVLR